MKINFKTLAAGILLSMTTTAAMADSFSYFTVTSTSGDTSYAVSSISKITFDTANMILWKSDSEQLGTLPLASLSKMTFTAEAAGIQQLESTEAKTTIDGGVLRVQAKSGSRITLYNMKGVAVKEVVAAAEDTEINLSGLVKGVYIVRVDNQSKKLMNK